MRVLVTGGRDYYEVGTIYSALNRIHLMNSITGLCHGDARGVDSICKDWALNMLVSTYAYPPDWKKWGRSAGVIRNKQMLDDFKPDLVIAFPGGAGTANMVSIAIRARVPTIYVSPNGLLEIDLHNGEGIQLLASLTDLFPTKDINLFTREIAHGKAT